MKHELNLKFQELLTELSAVYPDLLRKYPLRIYIKEMNTCRNYYNYFFISNKLLRLFDAVEKEHHAHGLVLLHKLALCSFVLNTLKELDSKPLPRCIADLYDEWVSRVYRDLSSQKDNYYHQRNNDFQKDLAVFTGRAVPIGGAWIAEISWNKPTDSAASAAAESMDTEISTQTSLRNHSGVL